MRRCHQEQQLIVAVVLQQQLVKQVDRSLAAVSLCITPLPSTHAAVVIIQFQKHLSRKEANVVCRKHITGGVYFSAAGRFLTNGSYDGIHFHQQLLCVVEAALRHATTGQKNQTLYAVWADGQTMSDAPFTVLFGIWLFGEVKEML